MPDTWTAKYFRAAEMECRCGCGLMNINPELVALLDRARDAFGRPIVIRSGCRCPAHNVNVKGKPTSAHLSGDAVDIKCLTNETRWMLLRIFFFLGFKRIGISFKQGFIHVDISKTLPQLVLWQYE